MKKTLIIEIISAILILLFTYTSLGKLLNHKGFAVALESIPALKNHTETIAWLLPVCELLIAFLLFIPATRILGLYASLLALVMLTGYLICMVSFMRELPCNCGGVINRLSWKQHIMFNMFFLIINIFVLRVNKRVVTELKRTPP
ncbi:MAG: hypothetical protein J0H29_22930 [Sphingobacteriales bacterium]|nr:hypothetical protein [Sphingobacteriales bacterium]OJY89685.1 MAG: hypothetical protein BGP14_22510 [Sphingobacteriales bacterium 44-15]